MLPSLVPRLRAREKTVLAGLVPGAKPFAFAEAWRSLGGKASFVVLVADNDAVRFLAESLLAFAPEAKVLRFPALTGNPFKGEASHAKILHERACALGALAAGEAFDFLVASAEAAARRLSPWEALDHAMETLSPGAALDQGAWLKRLEAGGYLHADRVVEPGEYSHRGGVVDVFPPLAASPIRVEFFGDKIESLRAFDPATQRSTAPMEHALALPASEIVAGEEEAARWREHAEEAGMDAETAGRTAKGLAAGMRFPGIEFHAPWLHKHAATLAETLRARFHEGEFILAADEPPLLLAAARRARDAYAHARESASHSAPSAEEAFGDIAELIDNGQLTIDNSARARSEGTGEIVNRQSPIVNCLSSSVPRLAADEALFHDYLRGKLQEGRRITLCVASTGRGRQLAEDLQKAGFEAEWFAEFSVGRLPLTVNRSEETDNEQRSTVNSASEALAVVRAGVLEGFEWEEANLVILSEREIFADAALAAPPRQGGVSAVEAFTEGIREIDEDDYVVHADHGVGRFLALRSMTADGQTTECMEIQFADGKIYVPVEKIRIVEKFAPKDASPAPTLDRLGSQQWQKTRKKMAQAMERLAGELLVLYAKRAARRGHAFPPDMPLQAEFEAAFPYELTPDQARAVAAVKADMESSRPMDRLLAGDVGFGKTEVAARAAFKAAQAGFQTALVAPTTVLASQHHLRFVERFKGFPVRVAGLSRLQNAKEQKKILADLVARKIDVIVGTHRLLSKDVRFARLGLVVTDEEQRFGVAQKEKLKKLCETVDALAMSATPIPRTLHMTLAGIRDVSVIRTPPPNRLAVHTSALAFDEDIIRAALERELRRGGQVFYVHNDIATLPWHLKLVGRLAPRAKAAALHGQMPVALIEKTMLDFLAGKFDVLVSTSIIENGVDIPRVNTLLVSRAHEFGLADLYQLRGRVGRSDVRAYAYLFVPPESEAVLTQEAKERMRAIQEFSFLGAGFHLAARDLEIRGAGSLLGREQSGHIAAAGFNMYLRILEDKIKELRGEAAEEMPAPTLRLDLVARIPETYVPETGERFRLYRKLAEAEDERALVSLLEETEDMFGPAPEEARALFDEAKLRLLARRVRVERVERKGDSLLFTFHASAKTDARRLAVFLDANKRFASRLPSGALRVDMPEGKRDPLDVARRVLAHFAG